MKLYSCNSISYYDKGVDTGKENHITPLRANYLAHLSMARDGTGFLRAVSWPRD